MSVWAASEPISPIGGHEKSDGSIGVADVAMLRESITSPSETVHGDATPQGGRIVVMRNSYVTSVIALVIWGVVVVMNVALLVLLGMKKT